MCKLSGCDLVDLLVGAYSNAYGADHPRPRIDPPEDCALLHVPSDKLLWTTDFGTLVGANLRIAGYIGALNALSDIYASGGIPKWALALLVVESGYTPDMVTDVMTGVLQACIAEGTELRGGHTIIGTEAMVGLTVIGFPRTGDILRKSGGRIGDHILLSKPLGVGLAVRAYRLGIADDTDLEEAIAVMMTSNGPASACAVEAKVHAATDVTGFGLLGHLAEMLEAGHGASIQLSCVPTLRCIGGFPHGLSRTHWTDSNLDYVRSRRQLHCDDEFDRIRVLLDPQTNGGLLVAADDNGATKLMECGYHRIGHITNSDAIHLCH
jgi:selenide,water dikinase